MIYYQLKQNVGIKNTNQSIFLHKRELISILIRMRSGGMKMLDCWQRIFLPDLQSGTLDPNPGLSASLSSKSGQASKPNSEEEADDKRRRDGWGSNKKSDFSAAPKTHSISSEPNEYKQMFNRLRPLFTSLTQKRGLEIIFYAAVITTKLMTILNGSVGPTVIIRGLTSVKGLEGVELLSTLITYLWRIDGVDYYGRIEPNEAKGFRHVRPERTGHEETGKSGSEWEKKLDSFWKGRLNGQDALEVIAAKEKIDAAAIEVLDPYVIKIRNEKYGWKYGCGAKDCTKFFMLLNLCTNI